MFGCMCDKKNIWIWIIMIYIKNIITFLNYIYFVIIHELFLHTFR